MKKGIIILALLASIGIRAQKKKLRYQDKNFQLSLVPGISSNGIHDGWYFNKFSLNFLSGVSAGSKHFEIAGISNLSLRYTTGIQIAGFANIIGSNAFLNLTLREERELINKEDFVSYFKGLQFAGFLNHVRDDVTGLQVAGGFNVSGGSTLGVQIAGIGSVASYHMVGVQISGLYNVGTKSVGGIQVSTLANYTNGTLYGTQISLINRNLKMIGKRSSPQIQGKSLQMGLINMSKNMNGTQIGIVNITREMKGTQIGIINIFGSKPPKDSNRNGLPIGLLNFGSNGGFLRFFNSELFLYNMEVSTGNCSNCSATQYQMPLYDGYQKFNQNAIIFSYNPEIFRNNTPFWSIGYGFERLMYIKRSMFPKRGGPENKAHFLSLGARVKHLNWIKEVDPSVNFQTSIYGNVGKRIKFLGRPYYLYVRLSINHYLTESPEISEDNNWMLLTIKRKKLTNRIWAGYGIGIQI